MFISATGVSHHETPVELRERFAFSAEQLLPALSRLPSELGGGVILSTCNRTELYLAGDTVIDRDDAAAALARAHGESGAEGAVFYHYEGADAVKHLYRVAAGIESLVIGESEILG
jgi:glutamyl-tRNA reductase